MANPPPLTAGRSANPRQLHHVVERPAVGQQHHDVGAESVDPFRAEYQPATGHTGLVDQLGRQRHSQTREQSRSTVLGISDDHQLRRREDVLRQKSGLTLQPRQPLCERIDLPVCRLDDLVGSRLLVENPAENLHLVLPRINLDVGQTGNCRSDLAQTGRNRPDRRRRTRRESDRDPRLQFLQL